MCIWNNRIAKKHEFLNSNYGEDRNWIEKLNKEAKTEYFIDKILHAYVYRHNTSEADIAKFRNTQI
jgi:hypothetical protein